MAQSFYFGSGDVLYTHLLRDFKIFAQPAYPRGLPTLEIEDCSVTVADAMLAVPLGTSRRVREAIGVSEYCQLLAGVSFLEQLDLASGGNFSQFADGGRLRGAYGPRAYRQLKNVARRLEDDKESRQGVVSLWGDSGAEVAHRFKDTPCTLAIQFRLRGGQLNATAFMRSSDVWLGLPYDLWMFSRLQMTMAWALGVTAGSLTVTAGSMHLYERDIEAAGRVNLVSEPVDMRSIPPAVTLSGFQQYTAAERLKVAQDMALDLVLGRGGPLMAHPSLEWNAERLPKPPGEWRACKPCRYVVRREEACEECP